MYEKQALNDNDRHISVNQTFTVMSNVLNDAS